MWDKIEPDAVYNGARKAVHGRTVFIKVFFVISRNFLGKMHLYKVQSLL